MVSNIKLALSPPRQTSQEPVLNVFLLHALHKLKTSSINFSNVLFTRLRLQMKKVAQKVEVGLYA